MEAAEAAAESAAEAAAEADTPAEPANSPSEAVAEDANVPPEISGTPASEVFAGSFFDFVPFVSDADGDPLTFEVVNLPSWAEFDAAIGRLSGTPEGPDIGVYADIAIRVSDGIAVSELGPFVISVNALTPANLAPLISGLPEADVLVGEDFSFTPEALDADGDVLSFEIFGAPSWAVFDETTGRLSGVPEPGDEGVYEGITIVVTDGAASASLPAFSVAVIGINAGPSVAGAPPASIEIGQSYDFRPEATDADGDALRFTVSNLPAWLGFDPADGSLSGTPGPGDVGTHGSVAITVSDGEAEATLGPFSIEVVRPNAAPRISGTAPVSVVVGQSFLFTPEATDADGDALRFTVSNLPAWLSFDPADGSLSGTPGPGDVGPHGPVVIRVTDGRSEGLLELASIEVAAVASGTAMLTWLPPTENTDGSPLEDLAGFVVYWGTEPRNYTSSEPLDSPGATSMVISDLPPGATYFFAVTAINSKGVESGFSNEASKAILQ